MENALSDDWWFWTLFMFLLLGSGVTLAPPRKREEDGKDDAGR